MNRGIQPMLLVALLVLATRLPFLHAGYGAEEDAWGTVLAAFHTATTGVYEYSRLPGHPVHEFACTLLWGSGPFVFNLATAFFGAIAVYFFGRSLQVLGFSQYILASLAFAFVPVVFISSTYSIDYMWAMAFLMAALYLVLCDKAFAAGICLGLAIGCRITSGAMLLPFIVLLWENDDRAYSVKRIATLTIATLVTGFACFVPLLKNYGLDFFQFYQLPYPPVAKVFYKATIGVFGLLGTFAIAAAAVAALLGKKAGSLFEKAPAKTLTAAALITIVLYAIAYLRIPEKSAFIIPMVPFIILLGGRYLSKKMFRIFCLLLIASPFVLSINLTDPLRGAGHSQLAFTTAIAGQEIFLDPIAGPVFSDLSKRRNKMRFTDKVLAQTDTLNGKNLLIAGWWYNELLVKSIGRTNPRGFELVFYAPPSLLEERKQQGFRIYYLPEQERVNDQKFGFSGTASLASPFH